MKSLLLFIFAILVFTFPTTTDAKNIEVSTGGSISQAVQSAGSGDTILIHAGTYKEQVNVDKQLTITSAGDGQVWIDGDCTRKHGLLITSSNVQIKNIGIKKVVESGILIQNTTSSNILIEKNTIQDFNCNDSGKQNSAGIASWYGGSGIKIIGNTITRRVEVGGGAKGQGNGVWFKSNDQNPSGGGHLISGNIITGGYDGIGGEEEGSNRGSFDKDTIIENNVIKDCADDGIQIEGGDVNVTVKNNSISNCLMGIAFAANKIGPLYVQNNTIKGDGNIKGSGCFKVGRQGSGTTYVTSNDCRMSPGQGDGGNGFFQTNSKLGPIISKGNNLLVARYVMELKDVSQGMSFNQDCMSTTDPERFIEWGGKRYNNLSSFQSGTGQEKNGTQSQNCPSIGGSVSVPATTIKKTTPKPTLKPTVTPTPSPTPVSTSVVEYKKIVETLQPLQETKVKKDDLPWIIVFLGNIQISLESTFRNFFR